MNLLRGDIEIGDNMHINDTSSLIARCSPALARYPAGTESLMGWHDTSFALQTIGTWYAGYVWRWRNSIRWWATSKSDVAILQSGRSDVHTTLMNIDTKSFITKRWYHRTSDVIWTFVGITGVPGTLSVRGYVAIIFLSQHSTCFLNSVHLLEQRVFTSVDISITADRAMLQLI